MEREILFRGKRLDNGEWVYGYFNHIPCGRFKNDEYCIQTIKENGRIGQLYDVAHATVGQYTGLTDKNGKKIFEWDVIEYHTDYDDLDGFTKVVDVRAVVVWNNDCASFGCIIVGGELDEFFPWFEMREEQPVKVIGNIHDNSELLEVQG